MGLATAVMLLPATKASAQISVGVSIQASFAPPEIPVYVQPECPVDGYLWQPGYWAWDPNEGDYYWVPGVWVAPPNPGYLWTPCYWGYDGGYYGFHPGYWGRHVGFYGGINYGGGFFGVGFAGGGWYGDHFRYNTAVVNVNRTFIHNTYIDRTVIQRNTIVNNRVSFNGGHDGVPARPRPEEQRAMNEHHLQPTRTQQFHQQAAHSDRDAFAKANHGRPGTPAVARANSYKPEARPGNSSRQEGSREGQQQNQPRTQKQEKQKPQ